MVDELDESASRRIGMVLRDKYTLETLLGVGGMAAVYRGRHRNGHRVAIKMLHPELSINADIRGRLMKEGYVANAIDHPGAVRVIDDDKADDGAVFLVMEMLEGETVDAWWERQSKRVPPRAVVQMAHKLLDVLAAAHAKGIIHRDIKPENVFLTREGQVKVLDFGIARMRDASGQTATKTGRMMGTPAFMPPEQALGLSQQIDGRTDLWAVGATMFTLVSGHFVHEAETMEQMIVFTASRPPRSLRVVAPDVPGSIIAVVDRALAFERENRFADARAMMNALETAYREAFGDALQLLEPSSFRQPQSSDPSVRAAAPASAKDHDVSQLGRDDTVLGPTAAADQAKPRALVVGSTTAGLSSDDAHPRGVPAKRSAALIGAIAVAALGIGAGAVWMIARPTVGAGVAPAALVAAPAPSASASALPSVAASAPEPQPVAPSPSPSTTASARPTAGATPAVGVQRPPVRTSTAAATPAIASAPAVTPPPARSAPDCNPPFTIDANGIRRVKPGC